MAANPNRVQSEGWADARHHPPGQDERIFDRFHRTVETQSLPGSGLGLAIVKKIVTDHGGQVFVGQPVTGGAEIGFSLPLASTDN